MPLRSPESDLAMLADEAERLERRRARFNERVDARLAENRSRADSIRTFIELRTVYAPEPPAVPKVTRLSPTSPFYGKPLAEAGAVLLTQVGRPMNEEEIVAGLVAAGVPMASTNPVVNFRMAARRRPDLLFTRAGHWYLTAIEKADPKTISTGCVPNRSREDHIAKSLEGLAMARARGVVGGRRSSISAETRQEAERLLKPQAEGGVGLPIKDVVQRLGMPRSTAYKIAAAVRSKTKPASINGHDEEPEGPG